MPVQPVGQAGTGGFSAVDIWGPFAGYGQRGRHFYWLLDGLGHRAEDLIVDGEWHIITAPVQLGAPIARLGLRFAGLAGQEGCLDIEWLRLTSEPPAFPISQTLPFSMWSIWTLRNCSKRSSRYLI